MGLEIRTTPARIEMECIPGRLSINTRNARLELSQKQAKVNITTEQPTVLINQYPCFAEEGLKNNTDLSREWSQRGYQAAMEFIAKKAQDGDAMAKIGNKANIMIDIARRNMQVVHEFGFGTMPVSRPEFQVVGGTVELEAEFRNNIGELNGVTGNFIPGEISFEFTPAVIKSRMASYGSIDIRYTGNNVDAYV